MNGWKDIHKAVLKGDKALVESLIDGDGRLVDAADPFGDAPLHVAAYHGRLEIAKALTEKGANPALKNNEGNTPYLIAKARGNKKLAEFLAEAEKKTPEFDTSLFDAIKEGKADVVARLVDLKGKLKNQRDKDGDAPIHAAALEGRPEVVAVLLDSGVDANEMGNKGNTPLHYAALKGHAEVASLLLERGAQLNLMGEDGKTPLHAAAMWGNRAVAELLIARGAEINALDNEGMTPLKKATKWRRDDIAELLQKHGGRE